MRTTRRRNIWMVDVMGDVDVTSQRLTSFQGCPAHIQQDLVINNNKLASFLYAPQNIGGSLYAHNNRFRTLHNIHKHIKFIGENINLWGNPIESHILGLCLIKGWNRCFITTAGVGLDIEIIINKYKHDINLCQEALIDAGYPKMARL